MNKNKTTATDVNPEEFIKAFADTAQKQQDSFELLKLMQEVSGYEPTMWGPTIIGFGSYHYKYQSGHEGDAPLVGFSPRKNEISLYVFTGSEEHKYLLNNLGKFKLGKACIYIKKLSDINIEALKSLILETISFLKATYA
jgi:hypothetical protein